MRRVLFRWRDIDVHAYPAMLYLGVVLGIIVATRAAPLRGLNAGPVYAAMLLLVLPALLGARLLSVLSHWSHYRRQPGLIWRRSEGGAALYGSLLASFVLSLPLLGVLEISVPAFWDAATLAMLITMIFTKVGCLLNGCCAGRRSDGVLALYLPNARGVWCRRRPAQLAEAAVAAIILLGALAAWNRLPFDGAAFLGALAAYGAARWGLEWTRESIDTVGRFSLHRIISGALVVLSVMSLVLIGLHARVLR